MIISIYHDYPPSGHRWKVALAHFKRVQFTNSKLRFIHKVMTLYEIVSLNLAVDWGMPAMIVENIQETLVYCPSLKETTINLSFSPWTTKDISQRIALILQPKSVDFFYISYRHLWILKREGLTRMSDYIWGIDCPFAKDRPRSLFEFSGEEVIPTTKAIVRFRFVALKISIVDMFLRLGAHPAEGWLFIEIL
jgi:hypothetical protein